MDHLPAGIAHGLAVPRRDPLPRQRFPGSATREVMGSAQAPRRGDATAPRPRSCEPSTSACPAVASGRCTRTTGSDQPPDRHNHGDRGTDHVRSATMRTRTLRTGGCAGCCRGPSRYSACPCCSASSRDRTTRPRAGAGSCRRSPVVRPGLTDPREAEQAAGRSAPMNPGRPVPVRSPLRSRGRPPVWRAITRGTGQPGTPAAPSGLPRACLSAADRQPLGPDHPLSAGGWLRRDPRSTPHLSIRKERASWLERPSSPWSAT